MNEHDICLSKIFANVSGLCFLDRFFFFHLFVQLNFKYSVLARRLGNLEGYLELPF